MNTVKRRAIFERFKAANPHPKTELEYHSPFELLVAVMLSAQATDISVNAATRILYPVANTPEAILALGEEGLREYIQRIGLYKTKARHVIQTCRILQEQHGGIVPQNRQALEALPGVGRKTANVILNTAFGQPTIAVDTHLFRLANRIGLAPGKTVLKVEEKLLKVIPSEFLQDAHHWLILHGRYICRARKPLCAECLIYDLCEYNGRGKVADADYSHDRPPSPTLIEPLANRLSPQADKSLVIPHAAEEKQTNSSSQGYSPAGNNSQSLREFQIIDKDL